MDSAVPSVRATGAFQDNVACTVVDPFTVMLKAGSEVVTVPSPTLITILLVVPALVGVPLRRPVEVLKVAQLGRFTMLKAKVAPASASLAVGWKL